jgi:rhodanese-related sulfurtransferase
LIGLDWIGLDWIGLDFSATIVVYCGSGRRAAKAEAILLEKEYKKVLNAGGLNDLLGFLKA